MLVTFDNRVVEKDNQMHVLYHCQRNLEGQDVQLHSATLELQFSRMEYKCCLKHLTKVPSKRIFQMGCQWQRNPKRV